MIKLRFVPGRGNDKFKCSKAEARGTCCMGWADIMREKMMEGKDGQNDTDQNMKGIMGCGINWLRDTN